MSMFARKTYLESADDSASRSVLPAPGPAGLHRPGQSAAKHRDVYDLSPGKNAARFSRDMAANVADPVAAKGDLAGFLARWITVEVGEDLSNVTPSKELIEEVGPLQVSLAERQHLGMTRQQCFETLALARMYLDPLFADVRAEFARLPGKFASIDDLTTTLLLLAKMAHGFGGSAVFQRKRRLSPIGLFNSAGIYTAEAVATSLAAFEYLVHPTKAAKHTRAAMFAANFKRSVADRIASIMNAVR